MKIKVYNDIANENDMCFFDFFGTEKKVFSAESVKDMLDENPDEKELHFDINCNGGSTREGFAIYDLLRTSARKIFCNIDGGCHSMATVILLVAPKENRTANPNATALIHDVHADLWGYYSAEETQEIADDLVNERNRILDIYVDRTGCDRDELETIMLEEKERTATELLDLGFISKINTYTTNINKSKQMTKKLTIAQKIKNFLNVVKVVNYDFTDADGNVLFSTENETDAIAVGDKATPDGTFELPDGRTVVIADGAITEIVEVDVEDLRNQIADLTAQLEAANTLNDTATELLNEAQTEIQNLANIRSKAEIQQRKGASGNAGKRTVTLTEDEKKAAIRAALAKKNGTKSEGAK
jgi:ATP-dependent Clp protease protease subunit